MQFCVFFCQVREKETGEVCFKLLAAQMKLVAILQELLCLSMCDFYKLAAIIII